MGPNVLEGIPQDIEMTIFIWGAMIFAAIIIIVIVCVDIIDTRKQKRIEGNK